MFLLLAYGVYVQLRVTNTGDNLEVSRRPGSRYAGSGAEGAGISGQQRSSYTLRRSSRAAATDNDFGISRGGGNTAAADQGTGRPKHLNRAQSTAAVFDQGATGVESGDLQSWRRTGMKSREDSRSDNRDSPGEGHGHNTTMAVEAAGTAAASRPSAYKDRRSRSLSSVPKVPGGRMQSAKAESDEGHSSAVG